MLRLYFPGCSAETIRQFFLVWVSHWWFLTIATV
jgi:hypothetical protein